MQDEYIKKSREAAPMALLRAIEKKYPYFHVICPMCGPFCSSFNNGYWQCSHADITESNRVHKEKHEEFIRMENAWREKFEAR